MAFADHIVVEILVRHHVAEAAKVQGRIDELEEALGL